MRGGTEDSSRRAGEPVRSILLNNRVTGTCGGNCSSSAAQSGAPGHGAPDWAAELEQLPPNVPVTLLFNKIDLTGSPAHLDESSAPPRIYLSAKTGAGLPLLRAHLKAAAGYRENDSGALSARRRHLDALRRARRAVEAAAGSLAATQAFELFAEDLRLAQIVLGEITGQFSSDDLLGEI